MTPTTADVILACIYIAPVVIGLLCHLFRINPDYDPNANDPYRYCPKEEDL